MGGDDKLDRQVEAMEMEMLKSSDTSEKDAKSKDLTLAKIQLYAKHRFDQIVALVRLYYRVYPKAVVGIGAVVGFVLLRRMFFRHRGETVYIPPHLVNHFGDMASYYDLQVGKIDHWCLRGGDDECWCQDPTVPLPREASRGWSVLHEKNVAKASNPPPNLDVVLLGDQFIQAWTGKLAKGAIVGGSEIQSYFNNTFQKSQGGLVEGITLGIDGDTTSNLLWRIQNGEMPAGLDPKVWWLYIGANDLAVTQCSEEAVIVGILRLADEIKIRHPKSVVVIQGILPRSSYADGHVKSIRNSTAPMTFFHSSSHSKKEYVSADHYPLWPSIQIINEEVAKFCAKHEHLLFFDASDIFFGSLGNEHFQASEKVLIQELFKSDHVTPSTKGFEILAKVIGKEVVRIVYNNDESNHIVTSGETR